MHLSCGTCAYLVVVSLDHRQMQCWDWKEQSHWAFACCMLVALGGSLFLMVPGQVLMSLELSFWMPVVSDVLCCILGQFLLSVILLNIMWAYHGRWSHRSTCSLLSTTSDESGQSPTELDKWSDCSQILVGIFSPFWFCFLKSSSVFILFTLAVSWQLKSTAGLISFLFLLWCWVQTQVSCKQGMCFPTESYPM